MGMTSSGKTSFSFSFARYLLQHTAVESVHIISADSRQVYEDIPILSGADVPEGFSLTQRQDFDDPVYVASDSRICLHLSGVLGFDEQWSLGLFQKKCHKIIATTLTSKSFVMIVGGTGLYHSKISTPSPDLRVPPNPNVRSRAERLSLAELQAWAARSDAGSFSRLNNSDRNNPRRLVRVIERSLGNWSGDSSSDQPHFDHYGIGLQTDIFNLEKLCQARVKERIQSGVIPEVARLLDQPISDSLGSTIGFADIALHLEGAFTQDQLITRWTAQELQYAKRQRTWLKKYPPDDWLAPFEEEAFPTLYARCA